MKLRKGTILEPKFDERVGHAVILNLSTDIKVINVGYWIKNIKTNQEAFLTRQELLRMYKPIGQEIIGRILYGNSQKNS